MEYKKLLDKITDQYNSKKPFAVYGLPNSETFSSIFQKTTEYFEATDFSDTGFILAPFNYQNKSSIIPFDESEIHHCEIPTDEVTNYDFEIDENTEDKQKYLKLIQDALKVIGSKASSKIVLSRKKTAKLSSIDIALLINRLLCLYPSAFRYFWYHPQTGIWCGASPEMLLATDQISFKTVALAGTQKYVHDAHVDWSLKEIEEQQLVTEAITTNLQRVTSVLKLSKTYNQRAGSLVHLRTDISGTLKNGKTTLFTLASAIHPTPAVCGSPKKIAQSFITEKEGYDRDFYTGFVGVVGGIAGSELYVNLRCLKIEENLVSAYVGGGIILGSVPEEEWIETHNKLQTMYQVIYPLL